MLYARNAVMWEDSTKNLCLLYFSPTHDSYYLPLLAVLQNTTFQLVAEFHFEIPDTYDKERQWIVSFRETPHESNLEKQSSISRNGRLGALTSVQNIVTGLPSIDQDT